MDTVFDAKNHFEYLKNCLGAAAARGTKTNFAKALRIQPAFLSQVLAEKYPLSLEQADLANTYFQHSHDESHFFLLLVGRDRAATPSLREYFGEQIRLALRRRNKLKARLGGRPAEVPDEVKGVYYSSWIYAALHVACTIPRLRNRAALGKHFQLPLAVVDHCLEFLEKNGFLRTEGREYFPTDSWVRLDKSSPHIVKHHTNWRLRAVQNLELQSDKDLHYSGVFSLDAEAAAIVREEFYNTLKRVTATIRKAKEEDLCVMSVDFFRLITDSSSTT